MRITPSIYLTSDTHFGHQKMVDVWGKRTQTHNEDMVRAWNSVVKADNTVLHLGDLTMTNKEATSAWTSQLNGHKYLVRGNHDGHSEQWLLDCGFTTIPNAFYKTKDKHEQRMYILFTHEPINIPVFADDAIWFNIHGHLHGDNHRNILTSDRHYDVGVDAHQFKPVQLSTILSHFKNLIGGSV